jgi:integrase
MSTFKRGGVWWFKFKLRGVSVRESSGSGNRDVARRIERDRHLRMEQSVAGLPEVARPKTFAVAAKEFLLEREPHYAPKTRALRANSLKHLTPHFGRLLLSEINVARISRYQRARLKDGVSNRTVNIELSLVRLVLRKARVWANIQPDVHMLKERTDIGRELSDDEMGRLLKAVKESESRSLYPAVLVSTHTGLRNKELRLLRWRQVDLEGRTVTVGASKTAGGEGRIVPLSQTAVGCLAEWRANFPGAKPEHFVFPHESHTKGGGSALVSNPLQPMGTWARSWRHAKKAARVECRWHDLRHSWASRIAAGGATDGTLQALAGWLSPKMIERYSHIRSQAKRDAIAVLDVVNTVRHTGHKNGHNEEIRGEQ